MNKLKIANILGFVGALCSGIAVAVVGDPVTGFGIIAASLSSVRAKSAQ